MFTKNWYAILANFAVGTSSTSLFKGVNTSGSETALSNYSSTNANASLILYNTLSKPRIASISDVGVYFGTGILPPLPMITTCPEIYCLPALEPTIPFPAPQMMTDLR